MDVMKRLFASLCGLALVFVVAAPAAAQQPGPQPPHQSGAQPGQGGQAPQMPMHGGGMPGGGMMGGGMPGGGMMMCPMMGGMMGGGMMGGGRMMGMMGGQTDPKVMGRMLQMRGEMLKAVGDVLIKHGKAMESEPGK